MRRVGERKLTVADRLFYALAFALLFYAAFFVESWR